MSAEEIAKITGIEPYFLYKIENIIAMEEEIAAGLNAQTLKKAKRTGFTDEQIASIVGKSREEITDMRISLGIIPTYKMVDTCAAEFEAKTLYYYSTYDTECELMPSDKKKVLILARAPLGSARASSLTIAQFMP